MPGIAKDVKEEILSKVKAGTSVLELSKLYGVSDKSIYNWLRDKAVGTVSMMEHAKLKRENSELKEIVGILSLELQKFKKNK